MIKVGTTVKMNLENLPDRIYGELEEELKINHPYKVVDIEFWYPAGEKQVHITLDEFPHSPIDAAYLVEV